MKLNRIDITMAPVGNIPAVRAGAPGLSVSTFTGATPTLTPFGAALFRRPHLE